MVSAEALSFLGEEEGGEAYFMSFSVTCERTRLRVSGVIWRKEATLWRGARRMISGFSLRVRM